MNEPGSATLPEYLEPGMLVTVLEYHDLCQQSFGTSEQFGSELWCRNPCTLGIGVPLVVRHVELPFVVVEFRGATCSIDTRECNLMRVSQEFADALNPNNPELPDAAVNLGKFIGMLARKQNEQSKGGS